MIGAEGALGLVAAHGLWLLLPVAILEGPIVTVLAGWLAHEGAFNVWAAYGIVIVADLVGDVAVHQVGRHGGSVLPAWLRRRLAADPERVAALVGHFRDRGGRTVVIAKVTHVAGLPVMAAAGAAGMPLRAFLGWSLLGQVPKSGAFLLLGWFFGSAWSRIDGAIGAASLILAGVAVVAGLVAWRLWRVVS